MKRIISVFLMVILLAALVMSSACSETFTTSSISKGETSKLIATAVKKTTGVGTAAKGSISSITSNFKMVLRARKSDGVNASSTTTVSGKSNFSMNTLKDGTGSSLLRTGCLYRLAYSASSASTVDSGYCGGSWQP